MGFTSRGLSHGSFHWWRRHKASWRCCSMLTDKSQANEKPHEKWKKNTHTTFTSNVHYPSNDQWGNRTRFKCVQYIFPITMSWLVWFDTKLGSLLLLFIFFFWRGHASHSQEVHSHSDISSPILNHRYKSIHFHIFVLSVLVSLAHRGAQDCWHVGNMWCDGGTR